MKDASFSGSASRQLYFVSVSSQLIQPLSSANREMSSGPTGTLLSPIRKKNFPEVVADGELAFRSTCSLMYSPPFSAMRVSADRTTPCVFPVTLFTISVARSSGIFCSSGGRVWSSSIPISMQPPSALLNATQSFANSLKSAFLPTTVRSDFLSYILFSFIFLLFYQSAFKYFFSCPALSTS